MEAPAPCLPDFGWGFSLQWGTFDTSPSGERNGYDSSKSRVFEDLDQRPEHQALSRFAQD